MKLSTPRLFALFLTILMVSVSSLSAKTLLTNSENEYGIDPVQSYPGTVVTSLLVQVEQEAQVVVTEAFDEGFKQGLLAGVPDAAYWKAEVQRMKAQEWPWWAFLAACGGAGAFGFGAGVIFMAVALGGS